MRRVRFQQRLATVRLQLGRGGSVRPGLGCAAGHSDREDFGHRADAVTRRPHYAVAVRSVRGSARQLRHPDEVSRQEIRWRSCRAECRWQAHRAVPALGQGGRPPCPSAGTVAMRLPSALNAADRHRISCCDTSSGCRSRRADPLRSELHLLRGCRATAQLRGRNPLGHYVPPHIQHLGGGFLRRRAADQSLPVAPEIEREASARFEHRSWSPTAHPIRRVPLPPSAAIWFCRPLNIAS